MFKNAKRTSHRCSAPPTLIAKATKVFDFGRWLVDDSTKMVLHGNNEVQQIATHFEPVFGALPNVVAQFVSLKQRIPTSFKNGTLPPFPASASTLQAVLTSFHTTWEKVLTWGAQSFGEIHTVVSAALSAVDVTAEVERGWSASIRRKGLHRVSTSAPVMDSSRNIMLHGPPLPGWDPTPAANAWFTAGKRGWRAVGKRRWRKDKGKPAARREEVDPIALAQAVVQQLGGWQPGIAVPDPCVQKHPTPIPLLPGGGGGGGQ